MKRPHRHGPENSAPPGILADHGTEALRRERFKEAIELFKQAIRQEPRPDWKESLADAWCGRARDLAAKSMFKEAAMVLENTIASGGSVRDPKLYLTCLIRDGQQQKAAAYFLSHPSASGAEHGHLDALVAALLVAVPQLPNPVPGATPEQVRWRELAVASRAALAAWCDGAPAEEIDRLLNAISFRSAFRPLRLLLKSLITAPADADRTRQVLKTISPDSPFYSLCQAVTIAMRRETELDADAWNRLTIGQQTFVAEISGLAAPAA